MDDAMTHSNLSEYSLKATFAPTLTKGIIEEIEA